MLYHVQFRLVVMLSPAKWSLYALHILKKGFFIGVLAHLAQLNYWELGLAGNAAAWNSISDFCSCSMQLVCSSHGSFTSSVVLPIARNGFGKWKFLWFLWKLAKQLTLFDYSHGKKFIGCRGNLRIWTWRNPRFSIQPLLS